VTKISQLSSIGDSLAIGDQFLIRDIDDAGSPNKSVTVSGITRALADGNATAPALAFAADKNTGIYRVGTDSLAVATNGTERLRIDSSGGATFKGGSIFIEATSDTNNAQISLGRPSSSSAGYIRYINSENALAFRTNGSGEDARIDSSGRLGIGTSSVSHKLHVFESSTAQNYIVSGAGSITAVLGTQNSAGVAQEAFVGTLSSSDFKIKTDNSEVARFTTSGRLGIGTIAPTELLSIGSGTVNSRTAVGGSSLSLLAGGYTVTGAGSSIELGNGHGNSGDVASWLIRSVVVDGGGPTIKNNQLTFSTRTAFANVVTERVRLDSSGRVGIGTTSPGYTLVLSATSANIEINDFTSPDATSETGIRFSNNATTHALLGRFGSQDFRISNTGNIVFATGGISTANEKARIDSSGRLLVGTSTASATATQILQGNSGAASGNGKLIFARGTTSPADGLGLGEIAFSDSSHSSSVTILAARDGGTWTSGTSQPTRLVFSTTADGASFSDGAGEDWEHDALAPPHPLAFITILVTKYRATANARNFSVASTSATPVVQPTAVADATKCLQPLEITHF
jgi:hypothetical protein